MPAYPYFSSPTGWMPDQQIEGEVSLMRLDSFFAVLAPQGQKPLQSYEDYQSLLEERISWMIQQQSEDMQMPLEQVYLMIQRQLLDDQISAMEVWTPGQSEQAPESWARALAGSARMRAIFSQEIKAGYPLTVARDLDIEATIEEQSLEEWLLLFTKN